MFFWRVAVVAMSVRFALVGSESVLTEVELNACKTQLGNVRANNKYIHVVEFGGGFETSELSKHEAVVSWSVVSHDKDLAESMQEEFRGSKRVSIKYIPGDYSIWEGKLKSPEREEGSLADFEAYVSEILYFGAKDEAAYWVFNFGKARVDVGIAALPLLKRTGGLMIISDWTVNDCYDESLLQLYDLISLEGLLAVLRPKDISAMRQLSQNDDVAYNWCFSLVRDGRTFKLPSGPSDTAGVIRAMGRDDIGCTDIGSSNFYCDSSISSCANCYGLMTAISSRGFKLRQTLKKILEAENRNEF